MSKSMEIGFATLAALTFVACGSSPLEPGDGTSAIAGSGGAYAGTYFDTSTGGSTSTSSLASGSGRAAGTSTPCVGQPVSWQTNVVSFQADDFWILADGLCFTSADASVEIHSDPGWSTYNTLELTWNERNREMRLNIYFHADASGWWSSEMRTYNAGLGYNADWLFYYGTFFKSPIGQSFAGDIDLTNNLADAIRGRLHIGGLKLDNSMTGH